MRDLLQDLKCSSNNHVSNISLNNNSIHNSSSIILKTMIILMKMENNLTTMETAEEEAAVIIVVVIEAEEVEVAEVLAEEGSMTKRARASRRLVAFENQ
jgi:hypothetical protein